MTFVLSKLLWLAADPGNLWLALLCAAAALLFTRRRAQGGRLVAALAAAGVAVTLAPLGTWLALPLENRFPASPQLPPRLDGIITLGGAVDQVVGAARGQATLTPDAERLTSFVALARRHPEARLVYTGGSGRLTRREITEPDVARRLFAELGLDGERVVFEDRSRNTRENALFSFRLVRPGPQERWVLVTSAMHMPRAVGCFRRLGWEVIPYPVAFRTEGTPAAGPPLIFPLGLRAVSLAAYEWTGLGAYRLLGYTDALWPGP